MHTYVTPDLSNFPVWILTAPIFVMITSLPPLFPNFIAPIYFLSPLINIQFNRRFGWYCTFCITWFNPPFSDIPEFLSFRPPLHFGGGPHICTKILGECTPRPKNFNSWSSPGIFIISKISSWLLSSCENSFASWTSNCSEQMTSLATLPSGQNDGSKVDA